MAKTTSSLAQRYPFGSRNDDRNIVDPETKRKNGGVGKVAGSIKKRTGGHVQIFYARDESRAKSGIYLMVSYTNIGIKC